MHADTEACASDREKWERMPQPSSELDERNWREQRWACIEAAGRDCGDDSSHA
jgi:hypothetical protein